MNYNDSIRQKIKDIFNKNVKIGVLLKQKDLSFIDKYEFEPNYKEGMGLSVSDKSINSLKSIIKEINDTPKLFNSFLDELTILRNIKNMNKELISLFDVDKKVSVPIVKQEYKENIHKKTLEICKKYGLKECYYIIDEKKSDKKNYIDAMLTLYQLEKDLNKIQNIFSIHDSQLVGKNILGVEINLSEKGQNGLYNSLNNTLVLNNKESLPTIHEYVHFIDKTNASLLFTGQNTQQIYESGKMNKETISSLNMDKVAILKKNTPINFFSNIYHQIKFSEEIVQNKEIKNIFNEYLQENDKEYKNNFKKEMYKWIYSSDIKNKVLLCEKVSSILNNIPIVDDKVDDIEHKRILSYTKIFNEYNELYKENNFMAFAKILDHFENKQNNMSGFIIATNEASDYYQSQKEMLARTIERYANQELKELSNRLSTPSKDSADIQVIIKIVSDWSSSIDQQLINTTKNNIADRIKSFKLSNKNKNEGNKLRM